MKKVTVLLIAACLLLALPDVLAKGKPGSDAGIFTPTDIWVSYGGDFAWEEATQDPGWGAWGDWVDNTLEEVPRQCYLGVNTAITGGRYDCQYDEFHGGMVSIDLTGINLAGSKMDPNQRLDWKATPPSKNGRNAYTDFCALLNDWDNFIPDDPQNAEKGDPLSFGVTRYWIGFMDGCDLDECPINIKTMSYSGPAPPNGYLKLNQFPVGPFCYNNGATCFDLPDTGFVLTGFANGDDVDFPEGDEPKELNAFTEPQELAIQKLQIKFGKLAECTTDVPDNTLFFITSPVPDE